MAQETHAQPAQVVVLGAGAMGCFFAGRLKEGGARVTLVDVDPGKVAHINANGLTLDDAQGLRTVPIEVLFPSELVEPPRLLIVFTKTMHTAQALAAIGAAIGPDTLVLTLQNGLGNTEKIAPHVATANIVCGVTDVPADFAPPATVRSHGQGKITFFDHQARGPAYLQELLALFERAGLDARIDPQVQTAIWEKVAFNAALNATTAVLRVPVGGMANTAGRALIGAIVDEVAKVASACAIPVNIPKVRERIEFALAEHVGHQPSMLQDVLAGRQTEIDSINGAIADLAESHGLAAPVNRTMTQLVKAIEAGRDSVTSHP